jgi:hypothetical protein
MTSFSASTSWNILTGMHLHWHECPLEGQSPTFELQGLSTIHFEVWIQIVLLTVSFSFWERAGTGEPTFVDSTKHGTTPSARDVLRSSYQQGSSSNLLLACFSIKPEESVQVDKTKNRLVLHTYQQTLLRRSIHQTLHFPTIFSLLDALQESCKLKLTWKHILHEYQIIQKM